MSRGGVRRVIPLTFGWEDLPKSVSVHGADPAVRLREPVPGVLCQIDDGWILLDTGFNDPLIRDPGLRRRFHNPDHGIDPVLPPTGDSLELAFERVGVDPGDIVAVAVSHLHNDHAGGLRHFAGLVPVHCQRRELDYGLHHHPAPERHGIFRIDFDDASIDWRLCDGDREIAPGIDAVATYGHTPGHQSFVVRLAEAAAERAGVGGYVFAFDAADLQENIDDELAVGGFIDCEPEQTVEAIRRLKAVAAEKKYRLLPGHDPDVWPHFTTDLGYANP
jgi:N-acyl homoserine lactone hydrolase